MAQRLFWTIDFVNSEYKVGNHEDGFSMISFEDKNLRIAPIFSQELLEKPSFLLKSLITTLLQL